MITKKKPATRRFPATIALPLTFKGARRSSGTHCPIANAIKKRYKLKSDDVSVCYLSSFLGGICAIRATIKRSADPGKSDRIYYEFPHERSMAWDHHKPDADLTPFTIKGRRTTLN